MVGLLQNKATDWPTFQKLSKKTVKTAQTRIMNGTFRKVTKKGCTMFGNKTDFKVSHFFRPWDLLGVKFTHSPKSQFNLGESVLIMTVIDIQSVV